MPRNQKRFDLEDRTFYFARSIRGFVRGLPKSQANREDISQLVRASGSIGANYIEANEALSKKDFIMRVKIARKEAKESAYWLRLIDTGDLPATDRERQLLYQEAKELMLILNSILNKVSSV